MQQIADRLYIGDLKDAVDESTKTQLDVILYLGQDMPLKLCFNCKPTCIHLPMKDGPNGLQKIRDIVTVALSIVNNDKKIMIACRAGVSRSVSIMIAVYAVKTDTTFLEAYNHLTRIRPMSFPEQNLLKEIKQIVEERQCFSLIHQM